jgi:hypothetical protein
VGRASPPALRTLGWFAAAGVLLGLAALTRPIAQLVVVLLAASLPFLWRWPGAPGARRAPLQTILLPVVALLGCFAIAVIPWMARNLAVQGTFAIAGGSGEGLAVRTIRYEQQFDFREPPGGDGDRVLSRARRIYRDEAEEGSAFELAGRLRDELEVGEVEADNLMRRIALDAIARRPIYYLQGTAAMFASTFVGRPIRLRQDWEPWRNIAWEERVEHLLPEPTPAEDRSFPVAEMLVSLYDPARLAAPIAILFAIGALAGLMPSRRPALLLAVLVLGLLLTGAALIGIEWRYRYPLDPLINVLVAGGMVASARWAVGLAPWTRRARAQHQGAAS